VRKAGRAVRARHGRDGGGRQSQGATEAEYARSGRGSPLHRAAAISTVLISLDPMARNRGFSGDPRGLRATKLKTGGT